jgi:anti-sigma-K factor RskA
VDRELTRAELDELLPLYALDALEGEEREQVARYVARDGGARAEVESLREAASYLPPRDVRAPTSLWAGIEGSLGASPTIATPAPRLSIVGEDGARAPRRSGGRRLVAVLAVAAVVLAVVLAVQVVRQQHRIDDLAAEMHRDPMEQQAMAARASVDAHVIPLDSTRDDGGAEVVMLPDGTGYLMAKELPTLSDGSTYQLWAEVPTESGARMVSLGILGRTPGISAFRLAATPMMFEVTSERDAGSDAPGDAVILRGEVS